MRHEPENSPEKTQGPAAHTWKRMVKRIRDQRRAHQGENRPRIPGENQLKVSLHEVWRIRWGTHESGAK